MWTHFERRYLKKIKSTVKLLTNTNFTSSFLPRKICISLYPGKKSAMCTLADAEFWQRGCTRAENSPIIEPICAFSLTLCLLCRLQLLFLEEKTLKHRKFASTCHRDTIH
jgi:hypothetical protein